MTREVMIEKLAEIGARELAEELLNLIQYSDEANAVVNRLLATPDENVASFRKKLKSLKNLRTFYHRGIAVKFARELEAMLMDLQAGVKDPLLGLKLMAEFYEADELIYSKCDDSNGNVGDVFSMDAQKLFTHYASQCKEKDKVCETILRLTTGNCLGLRNAVIKCAGSVLSEVQIRQMIDDLQKIALNDNEDSSKIKRYWSLIQELAQQIKDAEIYESAYLKAYEIHTSQSLLTIANIFFDKGDSNKALEWLDKITDRYSMNEYKCNELRIKIYRLQGETDKLSKFFKKRFQENYSVRNFNDLIEVIGEEQQDAVLRDAMIRIFNNAHLKNGELEFLLALGKHKEVNDLIHQKVHLLLDGFTATSLAEVAEELEKKNYFLCATLIYRQQVQYTLDQANYSNYNWAATKLKKLVKIANSIDDWQSFAKHDQFFDQLYQTHKRKTSFWKTMNYGENN